MTINFSGIATGFDVSDIIDQLLHSARRPIRQNELKIEQTNEYKQIWREIQTRVDAFQRTINPLINKNNFNAKQSSSTNPDVLTATVTGTPEFGTHNINVTQVASKNSVTGAEGIVSDPGNPLNLVGTFMLNNNKTVKGIDTLQLGVDKLGDVNNWLRGTYSAGYHVVVDENAASEYTLNVDNMVLGDGNYQNAEEIKWYMDSFTDNSGKNLMNELKDYYQDKGIVLDPGVYNGTDAFVTLKDEGGVWVAYGPDGTTPFSFAGDHILGNFNFRGDMVDGADNLLERHTFDFKIRKTPDTTGTVMVEAGDSLNKIAENINNLNLVDITATVIRVSEGDYRLVLDSEVEGEEGAIQAFHYNPVPGHAAYGTDNILHQLGVIQNINDGVRTHFENETQEAQDAELTLNGLPVERDSNTIDDLIKGITLNLAGTGDTTLDIQLNIETAQSTISEFVQAYNQLNGLIRMLQNEGEGILQGDPTLMRMERNLRSIMHGMVPDIKNLPPTYNNGVPIPRPLPEPLPYKSMASLGIMALDKTGILEIDSAKLRQALQDDTDGVYNFFNRVSPVDDNGKRFSVDGLARQMRGFTHSLTAGRGVIEGRFNYYNRYVGYLEKSNERLERRMEMMENTLIRRFTFMEQSIARMMDQSGFLDVYANAQKAAADSK